MTTHRKISHQINLLILTITAAFLMGSCSAKRNVTDMALNTVVTGTAQQRFETLSRSYERWDEVNVPLKVEVNSPMKVSASGRAYMKKGEWIYITMRFLGMEVVNMYVTTDSIFATDKINKRYVSERIADVFSGISLSDIQDIITGRVFTPSSDKLRGSDFEMTSGEDKWSMTSKKSIKNATYGYDMNLDNNMPQSLWVNYKDKEFRCDYSDPVMTQKGPLMDSETFRCTVGKEKVDISLRWSFGDAKWSVDNKPQWKQPSGYKRIDASQILKSF